MEAEWKVGDKIEDGDIFRFREEHPKGELTQPTKITYSLIGELQERYGSFRRVVAAYWTGDLSKNEEHCLEDHFPKETLVSYRPTQK